MKADVKMRDGRLLARIINLAHRFGCSYTHVDAKAQSDGYIATIQLKGNPDALRRLSLQLNKLLADDKC